MIQLPAHFSEFSIATLQQNARLLVGSVIVIDQCCPVALVTPPGTPQAEAFAQIARVAEAVPKRELDRFVRELKRCRPRRRP